MDHSMKLNASAFAGIKEGKQTIEVRLCDDKRAGVKIGDSITFSLIADSAQSIRARVIGLLKYKTFEDLFSAPDHLVWWNAKAWTVAQAVDCCRQYYSNEDTRKYGVLGIRIELL